MRRIHCLLALLFAGLLAAAPARAATEAGFTQAAFAAAQSAGKPILLHVNAGWCPTCARQRPIIESLAAEPENGALVILKVGFDSQKPVVAAFGVRMQSTLIALHGDRETGREVGITDAAAIRTLVAKTRG